MLYLFIYNKEIYITVINIFIYNVIKINLILIVNVCGEKMENIVLEVGFKLEEDMDFYDLLEKSKGLDNVYTFITHAIYYTNRELDGMTENELKCASIRLRNVCKIGEANDVYK